MSARRGQSALSGVVLLDKPKGPSSHDMVYLLRRATGERRIGHAGTLDPLASGLLVMLVGPATRLSDYLSAAQKSYEFTVVFGTSTDTDDAAGEVVDEMPVPPCVQEREAACAYLESLVGTHDQVPPQYSAIKVDGKRAYRNARSGITTDLAPRAIEVFSCMLLDMNPSSSNEGGCAHTSWKVRANVSKGTYIRSLARDIGAALGTCAHVGDLRRISCGEADVADALSADCVTDMSAAEIEACFVDPLPLLGFPVVEVDDTTMKLIANGNRLECETPCADAAGPFVSVVHDGKLMALYRRVPDNAMMEAHAVFPGGIHARDL